MTNKEYIEKWLNGTLTDSERQSFEKTKDFKSLERIDKHLQQFKAPTYNVEEAYDRLSQNLSQKTKVIPLNWMRPLLKVAAVALMAVVGMIIYNSFATVNFQTDLAKQSEVFLPDSSLVTLNAQSTISYSSFNWQNNRSLQLEGEAFFEVAKGSKFDVTTNLGTVSVKGTKFNVVSRRDYFQVVCFEGRVEVQVGDSIEDLTAGFMLTALNGKAIVSDMKLANKPSWILKESTFISIPFSYVLEELERQYGVVIQTISVDETLLFTGSFGHDDLELALKATTGPMGLKYTIQEDEIILTSEN